MGKKLHIGNLAYSVTDDMLSNVFTKFGAVVSANVIRDKVSGRSKGFGFVEMESEEDAGNAIEKLNKSELEGRTMFVSVSQPKESTGGGSGSNFKRRFDGGGRSGDRDNNRSFNRR